MLGLCLLNGVGAGLLFLLAAFCLPVPILRLFTADAEVIRLGAGFLRAIAWSYPLTAVSFAFAFALRSVGRPAYPMLTTFLAFGLNTVLNFLLIYGHWGLPRMGVAGSATATLIARSAEMAAVLGLVYGLRLVPAARLRELLDFSPVFAKKFYRTTLPVIGNESLWALGVTMFTVVYARMGTGVIAAYNIFATVERLSFVVFFGLAQACAVMVGQRIGAGEERTAFCYARRFAVLGPGLGLVIGGAALILGGPVLSLFHVPPAVAATAKLFLTVFALTIPIRIFNLINIVGILRSGGDTCFSFFLDTAGLWLIAVPLAYLAGLVWRLPPVWVYTLTALEEVVKCALGWWRFRSGRWINNLVCGMGEKNVEC